MIKLIEVQIDGKMYSFNTWTASKGLNILKKVTKIIGPALMSAMQNGEKLSVDIFKQASQELVMGLDQEDIGVLCKQILEGVRIDGKEIPFEIYFGGNYKELFKAILEVLKGNFNDFLVGNDSV